jgi:hypothetical protein
MPRALLVTGFGSNLQPFDQLQQVVSDVGSAFTLWVGIVTAAASAAVWGLTVGPDLLRPAGHTGEGPAAEAHAGSLPSREQAQGPDQPPHTAAGVLQVHRVQCAGWPGDCVSAVIGCGLAVQQLSAV